MRLTRAIRSPEAGGDDVCACGEELLCPRTLGADARRKPEGGRLRGGAQVIYVPMLPRAAAQMAAHAGR